MTYKIDSEMAPIMEALAKRSTGAPSPKRGDWQALRTSANAGLAYMASLVPASKDLTITKYSVTVPDGVQIELRWYTKTGPAPGSAVVYAHGGGMIAGSLDLYDEVVSWYVSETGVPFLAVEYRLAPEASGTSLAEDVFAAVLWLVDHSSQLQVDPQRIALMGDSGGGGPTAGAAILARDKQLSLARQILIYPALDDRNVNPDPTREPFLTWSYDNNFTAWSAMLGDKRGTNVVSPIAAPARLKDFSGLAPAYIDVGDLDIFRDENIAYAQKLAKAGVPVELHVYPGVPHGFERFGPNTKIGEYAMKTRAVAIELI